MTSYKSTIDVYRDGVWREVSTIDLVPGDTVKVRCGILPCDMVLVHGSAVCDESGLTGESMPVGKSVLMKQNKIYSPLANKSSTLFGGTIALQTGTQEGADKEDSIAVVIATGIRANKGQLISNILHPTPMTFKYDEELPLVQRTLLIPSSLSIVQCRWFLCF